ncbi:MAG TPA: hypothetical protein VFN35_36400, partial [Ktedonobacteraceae bacterium]|nr:hypothetical protein [Ktedonobacteraceae bacterium]
MGSDGTSSGGSNGGYILWYQHGMPVQDYEVTAKIQFVRSTAPDSFYPNDWEFGIMVRGDGNLNGYEGGIVGGNGGGCFSNSPEAIIALVQQDDRTTGCDSDNGKVLQEVAYTLDNNVHTYLVKVQGNIIQLFLDGQSQPLLSTTDNTMIQSGRVGLRSVNDDMNALSFTVTAL